MKKKKLLGINFLCGAVSILAFLVLWNIAVQGELGKMLPGPIPVLVEGLLRIKLKSL